MILCVSVLVVGPCRFLVNGAEFGEECALDIGSILCHFLSLTSLCS